jgi:hypothetical protein
MEFTTIISRRSPTRFLGDPRRAPAASTVAGIVRQPCDTGRSGFIQEDRHRPAAAGSSGLTRGAASDSAAAQQLQDDDDEGNDEQDVNEPARDVHRETEKPQDQQDNDYCPQHATFPPAACVAAAYSCAIKVPRQLVYGASTDC